MKDDIKEHTCTQCGLSEPEVKFYRRANGSRRPQSTCSTCAAKIAREYRQEMRDRVGKYKMASGCVLCGFVAEHPCQLDLDHIDPATKTYKGCSKSYDAGWKWERIVAEIGRCQVLCKNCHSLRTYKEGHWKNASTDIKTRMRQSGPEDV